MLQQGSFMLYISATLIYSSNEDNIFITKNRNLWKTIRIILEV